MKPVKRRKPKRDRRERLVNFVVTPEEWDEIEAIAQRDGITKSGLLREGIRAYEERRLQREVDALRQALEREREEVRRERAETERMRAGMTVQVTAEGVHVRFDWLRAVLPEEDLALFLTLPLEVRERNWRALTEEVVFETKAPRELHRGQKLGAEAFWRYMKDHATDEEREKVRQTLLARPDSRKERKHGAGESERKRGPAA